jgi:carbonic anhydrase
MVPRRPPLSDVAIAVAQQSPIDIRGDELVIEKPTAIPPLWFHYTTHATVEVDGQRFPMEMHLVHNGTDGSTLVIGVFLRAGAANSTLTPILNNLPTQSGGHVSVADVDIAKLIPEHAEKSARYTGSLTTPPFTEGEHWIVLAPPIDVSPAQMAEFGALFPEGNAREVQALDGRSVGTHDRHFLRDGGIGNRESGTGD